MVTIVTLLDLAPPYNLGDIPRPEGGSALVVEVGPGQGPGWDDNLTKILYVHEPGFLDRERS